MASGSSPWCCWCASYQEEGEEEWRRRKREQLLECLRQVKGLSPASHLVLRTDAAYLLDDVEQKLFGDMYGYVCGKKCGSGGFGNSFCLLVWLGVYALIMLTLQFKLYKLLDTTPLPKVWDGASSLLRVIEQDYVTEFHVYYSASIALMIMVMSSAFLSARTTLLNFIQKMTRQLIKIAQDEMRTEVRDSIDYDFYAFINRLPQYFFVSPDLTKPAIRRVHRQLHSDLDARICMMDYDVKGALSINREVQQRIAGRVCCCSFFFFCLPWFITVIANLCLIVRIFAVTYGLQRDVQVQKPDVLTTGDFGAAFRDEGTQFIGCALFINLISWLYLAIIQLHCVTFSILHSLYARICIGIVFYCDRILLRIWDEAVLNNVADYIEDVKKNVEFSEEKVQIPVMQQGRFEIAHPLVPKLATAEMHREVVKTPPPTNNVSHQAPASPAAKCLEEPVSTGSPRMPTSIYTYDSSASDCNKSTLTEPLVLGRKSFWKR